MNLSLGSITSALSQNPTEFPSQRGGSWSDFEVTSPPPERRELNVYARSVSERLRFFLNRLFFEKWLLSRFITICLSASSDAHVAGISIKFCF